MSKVKWFGDKARQVDLASLIAFGIDVSSRYGKAEELREILKFTESLAVSGCEGFVSCVTYDGEIDTCEIDLKCCDSVAVVEFIKHTARKESFANSL